MKTVKLGEIAELTVGFVGSMTEQYVDEGVPFLRSLNIKPFEINNGDIRHISEEFNKKIKKSILHAGDVVIVRTGAPGTCCVVPEEYDGCNCSDVVIVRPNIEMVDPLYLAGFVNFWGQKQISNNKVGAIQQHFNVRVAEEMLILLPDLDEQRIIANILGNLNRKIRVNKAINDNLQQLLKLLYDYWFTQFDFPDSNGKPYKSSGGTMASSDKVSYKVPAGWKVETLFKNSLSDILKPGVEYFTSKTYLATADVNGIDISSGSVIDYETRENRANMQPTLNSVWFAKMKNSNKHLYLNKEMQQLVDGCILSTGFCGLQCTEESFEYISSFIEYSYFEIQKDMLAHGATQESVNNDDLSNVAIVVPSNEVLHLFHQRTSGIYSQISKNICENKELTKLRDWLLPMLMNGQATIND